MARPNFDVSTQGTYSGEYGGPYHQIEAPFAYSVPWEHVVEQASGLKRRKPIGWIPPTNYFFRRDFLRNASGKVTAYDPWWEDTRLRSGVIGAGGVFETDNICTLTYVPQYPPHLYTNALIKARTKMKRSDVNLGVAFAERNATARLLGDTASRLAKAYRALRHGNLGKVARELGISRPKGFKNNKTPQRWLELQYGWEPLLSDVYGSVEALSGLGNDSWRITSKATSKVDVDVESVYDYTYAKPKVVCKGVESVFVRIDAVPENDLLQAFSSTGITNPALIAWELVPFSFVVDWAWPIGNFLDSLDAMLGYGETDCSITSLTRLRWDVFPESANRQISGSPYPWEVSEKYNGRKDHIQVRRTATHDVPLPSLPRLKNPVSFDHMANGLSLLASAFGR